MTTEEELNRLTAEIHRRTQIWVNCKDESSRKMWFIYLEEAVNELNIFIHRMRIN